MEAGLSSRFPTQACLAEARQSLPDRFAEAEWRRAKAGNVAGHVSFVESAGVLGHHRRPLSQQHAADLGFRKEIVRTTLMVLWTSPIRRLLTR